MDKKRTTINERQIRSMVRESIKKALNENVFQGAGMLQDVYDKLKETKGIVDHIGDWAIYGSEEHQIIETLSKRVASTMYEVVEAGRKIGVKVDYNK